MPVTNEFVENGRVLVTTASDPWETHEMMAFWPEDRAHRNSMTQRVHLIIDITHTNYPPKHILQLHRTPSVTHPNRGLIVVVGANSFSKTFVEMIFRLARYERVKFFATMHEAINFLRRVMATEDVEAYVQCAEETPCEA
jgi:hypothetical protein